MRNQIALETDRPVSIRPSRRSHTLIYMLETSTAGTSTGVISWPWEPGLLGSSQQPWTAEWPKGNSQFLLSPMERRHQFGPGLREFRPGQPTAGQTCPRKHPAVTTLAFPYNATKRQGSCPQRSGEALELSQGWLDALLPSHRWMRERLPPPDTTNIKKTCQELSESLLFATEQPSHVAVTRIMCHVGTKSARPVIAPSSEP